MCHDSTVLHVLSLAPSTFQTGASQIQSQPPEEKEISTTSGSYPFMASVSDPGYISPRSAMIHPAHAIDI
ncbi:hypothetical protein TVAGG3_0219350 [Trichomonas vaginalis G3]|uniref:hypothetical protein n=1 Tax=Trichomonas vaginalis (strain ATCC PRA-98 / G3) TaxID=412133 RepID=UPI0021E55236|nr:hypothetical protein TVAGG3_0219350 [Trichomonas vaginalis G3]KAI5551801.1 hypothetical protein TVAGG3_0219350 [Trichomonas vaginalis G3]